MKYWLIKSEPDAFSISDLKKAGTEPWDGIRNYQARNFMRDEMSVGDLAIFYHSNTKIPGAVGVAEVASECYPDHTQFDKKTKYYDPKSKEDNPRWLLVDFTFVAAFDEVVSLETMKGDAKLEEMLILRKGNRLSITPLEGKHFRRICKLAGWDPKSR